MNNKHRSECIGFGGRAEVARNLSGSLRLLALAMCAASCAEAAPTRFADDGDAAAPRSDVLAGDPELRCRAGGLTYDFANDTAHCGGCDVQCAAPPGVEPVCMAGVCRRTCPSGTHPCSSDFAACFPDGSTDQCGSALLGCVRCDGPRGGSAACRGGVCVPSCPEGSVLADGRRDCVLVAPTRAVSPLSNSVAGPVEGLTFRWQNPPHADGARVVVWRVGAGRDPVWTASARGTSVRLDAALPPGNYYWNLRSMVEGRVTGVEDSPPWLLRVTPNLTPARARPVITGRHFDVEHNGYADLLIGETGTGNVQVVMGPLRGGAAVALVTPTAPFGAFDAVESADVNGDDRGDVIGCAREANSCAVFSGSTTGVGRSPSATVPPPEAQRLLRGALVAADLNGDGIHDVASLAETAAGGATLVVALGAPDARTLRMASIALTVAPTEARLSEAGDVNGDGYGDLAVLGPRVLAIYKGTASGPAARPLPELTLTQAISVSAAGDINGDGYGDLAVLRRASGALEIVTYHGGSTGLNAAVVVPLGAAVDARDGGAADDAVSLAYADVDGDGLDDLLAGWPARDEVRLFLGSPRGLTPSPAWRLEGEDGGGFGARVVVGEYTGDALLDVIVSAPGALSGAGRVYVFQGVLPVSTVRRAYVIDGAPGAGLGRRLF